MRTVELTEDVPRINEEYLVLAVTLLLTLVEEPERARKRHVVEEVGTDRDHDVHAAILDQPFSNFELRGPRVGRRVRHHETGPTLVVKGRPENLHPEIVRVIDFR